MRKAAVLLAGTLCIAVCATALAAPQQILVPEDAADVVKFAAAEARRYVYVRTGTLLPIVESEDATSDAIVVGSMMYVPASETVHDMGDGPGEAARLEAEYVIKTVPHRGHTLVVIAGASDTATLYGVYRFAELLGVRFFLHGDVIPDERIPLSLPTFDIEEVPLFATRGILPFHDFPEGPDWWNLDDYKAVIGQLAKLRMNFIGFHTYPEGQPNAEPTVWIGRPEDVHEDGAVGHGYPATYYNTVLPSAWGYAPKATGAYPAGAAALYDRDDFGSEIMRGLTPRPETPEECIEVFNRTGAMFRDAFTFARFLGVKTCIGTETPLTAPRAVRERYAPGLDAVTVRGGRTAQYGSPITGTTLDAVYQSVRYDLEGYDIALPEGFYTVTLHFCEVAHRAMRERVFDVKLEGITALEDLDIYARAGRNTALDITFEMVRVADGVLNIEFVKHTGYPAIAGISVTGDEVALRINCGGSSVDGFVADDGSATLEPQMIQDLYAGIFTRIMAAHPLDYYWLWTPETWTWEGAQPDEVEDTIADIRLAISAAEEVGAPFQLATCGWVLGPQDERALFGRVLPPGMPVSSISREVGHAPLEPAFGEIQGREKWAIPWLEDDPAMVSPQLWAGRMRRDAYDAYRYGCTGLLGIHWRTRIIGPNVAALAQAAWDQAGWAGRIEPSPEYEETGARSDNTAENPEQAPEDQAELPRHVPAGDFYQDWATALFGEQPAAEIAAVFARVDGILPRPSEWVDGPGGFTPDPRPWETVAPEYAFLEELEALREEVTGPGNLERFDYWLNTFRYMRETDRMRGLWHSLREPLETAENAPSPEEGARLAREVALPAYRELVACVRDVYTYLLASVTTSGGMGNVTNLEQHSMPGIVYEPGERLAALLGEPLPADALLGQEYHGPARVFVRTVRTSISPGEELTIGATLLSAEPPERVALYWRALGAESFEHVSMEHAARGNFTATLPARAPGEDIEYYIAVIFAEAEALLWPPTAPDLNQTLVVLP